MKLPETNPNDDPEGLWALQQELLMTAEATLGPRDPSKEIHAPRFVDDGPRIFSTDCPDGAFVKLSRNGECYWPTVVFEMAHETVHLLNPVRGNTNYCEEGVAVAFWLAIQPSYGVNIPVPSSEKLYMLALQLVGMFPGGPLEAGRRVRERVDALSSATVEDLRELFPSVELAVLGNLVEPFDRDMGRGST